MTHIQKQNIYYYKYLSTWLSSYFFLRNSPAPTSESLTHSSKTKIQPQIDFYEWIECLWVWNTLWKLCKPSILWMNDVLPTNKTISLARCLLIVQWCAACIVKTLKDVTFLYNIPFFIWIYDFETLFAHFTQWKFNDFICINLDKITSNPKSND